MINKTVESGRSRVGQCGRPPPKTSARHLELRPQSGIRFSSPASSTLTTLWEIARSIIKSLTNVFHRAEKEKVSVKMETFLHFCYTFATSCCFSLLFFFPLSQSRVRYSSMNNYRKSLVPVSGETRVFSVLPKASRNSHSQRRAELRFRGPVTRSIDRLRSSLAAHFSRSRPR